MREARLQFEASRIAIHMTGAMAAAPRRSMFRRVAMPLLAASVWLGIAVGSISAAQAGGPLYAARMWIENVTVPQTGAARANAELARLDSRLSEAWSASIRGDTAAVQAALDAYSAIADEAIAASTGDPSLEAIVAAALDKHRLVLSAVFDSLAGKGNDTAAAAIELSIQRAIDHNQAVIDRVEANRAGSGSGGSGSSNGPAATPGTGSGAGTGTGAGNGTGDGTGAGSGTGTGTDPKPAKTPKPTPEPKPTPTPPDPQDQPDHSPRGQNR
jgi:hypothetical protein